MTEQATAAEAREKLASKAGAEVRRAILQSVRETGGQVVHRSVSRNDPGSGTMLDVEATAGLTAARAIELAARRRAKEGDGRNTPERGHGRGRADVVAGQPWAGAIVEAVASS